MVLRRVSGVGSVLESVIGQPEALAALGAGVRRELLARSTELAELARFFRSDILCQAFDQLAPTK